MVLASVHVFLLVLGWSILVVACHRIQGGSAARFVEIPVDHFGNTGHTYRNRYWLNDTYYQTGGPVFLFDAGEQDAEPLHPYYLQEYHGLSAVMRLAKRYHGVAILWEHRFYGASLPFALTENTTADQWNLLNTEQALEDFIFFANTFSRQSNGTQQPLHPHVTPWVWLGASYPGSRGAFLRIRNPEIIFAAWASSAPPQAQINMPSYFQAAQRSLTRNCSADWVAVTRYVDDVLRGTDESLKTETKFMLRKAVLSRPGGNITGARGLTRHHAAKISDVDTGSMLLDPLNNYQYYGFQLSVLPFCNLMQTRNFTIEPRDSGIAAASGVQSAFAAFVAALAESEGDSDEGLPFDKAWWNAWMWQYCSEYGFFMTGDAANLLSIATSFLSVQWYQTDCNNAFPEGALPTSPQIQHVLKYGGWHMNPSNVFFTNGEFDPWRTLSLASEEVNSPQRRPTSTIPACNIPPPGASFFGITHKNMVHSPDMRVLLTPDANHSNFKTIGYHSPISPEAYYLALDTFQRALDEWLPCFVPKMIGLGGMRDICMQNQLTLVVGTVDQAMT